MRTKLLAAALLLLALPVFAAEQKPLPKELPAFGADRPLPTPQLTEVKTADGLTVWIVARSGFPKVTCNLVVRGGSAADPQDLPGLNGLLAGTLKSGTPTRSAAQIAEQLAAVGGQITTSSNEDAVFVAVNGLGSGISPLLTILADVARHASFPASEVKLAQETALSELQAQMATPEYLGGKAFAEALYGSHPYHVTAPTTASISTATPEILRREFARRFRPERALLLIVGDVDAKAAERLVTAAFGGWKGTGEAAPQTPAAPTTATPGIRLVDRPNSVQSLIMIGSPGPKATDPEYYPMLVANTIFGGAFGSRLTLNIREDKGYTYSPGSAVQTREQGGRLRVRADVRNAVTGASLNEMFYEMTRMGTTSPTESEMATAKRLQVGLFLLRGQSQGAFATVLAANWINGLPPKEVVEFVQKVNAVTIADVDRVGKSEYPVRRQVVVVVGDSSKVKADVAQFGPVTDIKP
jgi:zinc protease